MTSRIEKIIWSVVCGTALGLGTAGCYDSDDEVAYGPPPDVSVDGDDDAADDAVEDAVEENIAMYGPAPAYGPEPSP